MPHGDSSGKDLDAQGDRETQQFARESMLEVLALLRDIRPVLKEHGDFQELLDRFQAEILVCGNDYWKAGWDTPLHEKQHLLNDCGLAYCLDVDAQGEPGEAFTQSVYGQLCDDCMRVYLLSSAVAGDINLNESK